MAEETTSSQYLRGGEFIIRETDPGSVFIPEDFDEEQRMVKGMVIDFVREIGDRAHVMDEQVKLMNEAAELGLVGAHIPAEYGGTLLPINTNTLIAEVLGAAGGSFDTTFAAHIGIGMLPILYFGTDEQKKRYLPALCSGKFKAAYCLTEPGSGSDALSAKTRADMTEDEKHYRLNGQKMWISNAGFADVFIVFAQIDGEHFTGFIVDAHSDGITLGEEEHKLGIKGSSTRQVFFENVLVPVENLLGEKGKGHRIAFNSLNIGRFKLGTMSMGGSKIAIEKAVQYANERVQFGKKISSFGAIQFKLSQQAILCYAMESAVYRVSGLMQDLTYALLEQGKSYGQATLEAAREYASECAIIKVAGSEYLDYVVDEWLQILGGYGFSEEYPPARAYRDQRINRIYEGTNEINRLLMINQVMKKAFSGEIDLVGPAWEVQKELTRMPSMERPQGDLAEERKAVADFKKILLLVAGAAAKYQMDGAHDLREEQEIVMNIADIAIDSFIAESLLLRVLKIKESYIDGMHVQDDILSVFLHDAQGRILKNAQDALASFATGNTLSILLKGLFRFAKYPPQNVKQCRRKIAGKLIEANEYAL